MAGRPRRLQHLVLAVVLLGIGIWTSAVYAPGQIAAARASRGWTPVAGVVEATSIAASTGAKGRSRYVVTVAYRWEVGGETYRGDRYSATGTLSAGDEEGARLLARGFREGDPITVLVDPQDPSQAMIAQGDERKAWFVLAFGVALLLAAGWVVVRRVVLR